MVNYIHFMINYWPWLHNHIGQATSPNLSTIRQFFLLCCINQLIERKKKEKRKKKGGKGGKNCCTSQEKFQLKKKFVALKFESN